MTDTSAVDQAIDDYKDRNFPTVVMLISFCVIGIPGNLIVVLIYYRGKKMTTAHFLIFIIAILDSFICVFVVPLTVISHLYWLEIQMPIFCKLVWGINVATISSGIYMIAGVSVVRYVHVCKPTKLNLIEPFVKPFCMICFLLGFIMGVLIYITSGNQTWHELDKNTPGYLCSISDKYLDSSFYESVHIAHSTTYTICLVTIITFNSLILKQVFEHKQVMASYKRPKRHTVNKSISNAKLTEVSNAKNVSATGSMKNIRTEDKDRQLSIKSIERGISSEKVKISEIEFDNPRNKKSDELGIARAISSSPVIIEKINEENVIKKGSSYSISKDVSYQVKKGNKSKEIVTVNLEKEENEKPSKPPKPCCEKCASMCVFKNWNRTTLKLFMVSFVYVVTYTPYFAISLYLNTGENISRTIYHNRFKYIYIPGLNLGFLSSTVNPIIYTFADPKFRSQLFGLLKQSFSKRCCKSS